MSPRNFALIGVGGYVAPRHLRAIRATGNRLVAAVDPRDSVGFLDEYDFQVRFFTEIERFDRHLEKLRRGNESDRVHFLSVCSPNYLHDAHCRLGLRVGADVICEKPLVINPWNLDHLEELEHETGRRINAVLQLRLHPELAKLRDALVSAGGRHDVVLTNISGRGHWYSASWKGQDDRSGGLATNIGVHFFDLLIWMFGAAGTAKLHHADGRRMSGFFDLERANVRWFISVDPNDLPPEAQRHGNRTYRSIEVDGQRVAFADLFSDLHTRVYEEVLAGRGFGIADARPAIDLAHRIRTLQTCAIDADAHPFLKDGA